MLSFFVSTAIFCIHHQQRLPGSAYDLPWSSNKELQSCGNYLQKNTHYRINAILHVLLLCPTKHGLQMSPGTAYIIQLNADSSRASPTPPSYCDYAETNTLSVLLPHLYLGLISRSWAKQKKPQQLHRRAHMNFVGTLLQYKVGMTKLTNELSMFVSTEIIRLNRSKAIKDYLGFARIGFRCGVHSELVPGASAEAMHW